MDENERRMLSLDARLGQLEDAFAIFVAATGGPKAEMVEGILREQAERHLMHSDHERRAKFALHAQAGTRLADRLAEQIALFRTSRE